jgi:hypothetical protein
MLSTVGIAAGFDFTTVVGAFLEGFALTGADGADSAGIDFATSG